MKDREKEDRAKEFLECMGNGRPIHQCEEDTINHSQYEPELEDCKCEDKAWIWLEDEECWKCENCGARD